MDRTAYDRFFELEKAHFWRIAKRRLIMEWVKTYAPQGSTLRLLDIGGACSLLPGELRKLGEVTVIEPDRQTVAFAQEMLHLDIREGWLPDNLPVEGAFDVVTLLDVLEHIDDETASFKTIWRVLRSGGLFICTVPALKWLWSEHDISLGHRRRYIRSELGALLTNAGFTLHRLSYYTSLLLPILAVQRLTKRVFPRADPHVYRLPLPPAPVNAFLGGVMSIERVLVRSIDLPIGSSLIAACSKPAPHDP